MSEFNENQMKALKALAEKWQAYSAGPGAFTEAEAALYQGREDGHQSCADDLMYLLSSELFKDDRMVRVVYRHLAEPVPFMTKPLSRIDAEALAAQYIKQGLDVSLSPVG